MKHRNHKDETPSLRESAYLVERILRKLCQEKVFPKRSRWVIAQKIADTANEYLTAVIEANDPKVQTEELRERRFTLQQIALGKLSALDVLINMAIRVLSLKPENFKDIADRIITCEKLLKAWIASDEKRYGPPSGAERYRE
ncbi:MAG: hypothetical protein IKG01_07400 [Lachnospiraceae bacterium]|nr:hypothetical protein [Lachnospiraceae bacterium]